MLPYYYHRDDPPTGWNRDWDSEFEWYNIGTYKELHSYKIAKVSKGAPPSKTRIIHAKNYYTDTEMVINNRYKKRT